MSQLRHGRAEAAAVIWAWRSSEQPLAAGGRARAARRRGLLQAAAGAAIGAAIFSLASRPMGAVVMSVAGVIAVCALASPLVLFAALERVFESLGRGLGHALSWALLPLVFYAFFVPFGVLFRRGRRDSMGRFFDPSAKSYWKLRPALAEGPSADPRRRYRP